MRGEQVSGLAVHTAAPVMAAAGDGEVLVSDAMRDAIRAPEVDLHDRGRHELKGVPGEWQLYWAEPSTAERRAGPAASPRLPFRADGPGLLPPSPSSGATAP